MKFWTFLDMVKTKFFKYKMTDISPPNNFGTKLKFYVGVLKKVLSLSSSVGTMQFILELVLLHDKALFRFYEAHQVQVKLKQAIL